MMVVIIRNQDPSSEETDERSEEITMAEPVCVISGVGPGTGSALVRRFAAGGYRIAMLARNAERLTELAKQVPAAKAYVCDVSDQSQVIAAMDLVECEMG